jgi:hypothetical protein
MGGKTKKVRIQLFKKVKMMNQKLEAKMKWKQNEWFDSKELFIIAKSQISRALILGLKNIDWVVLMKR